jgi:uncharacterized protein (DUF1697 family)
MSRYAAFLRGINVGGHRVTNEELRARFSAMGFAEVASFRASGNVVFTAQGQSEGELTDLIEDELARSLGYQVATFLRTASEIGAMAERRPFDSAHVEASNGKLQVSLLRKRPSARVQRDVLALATDSDRLAFTARELYWLPSGGMLEAAIDLKSIDALLGTSTRRTKATIERIADKHFTAASRAVKSPAGRLGSTKRKEQT